LAGEPSSSHFQPSPNLKIEKSTKMLLDDGKRFVALFDILGFGSWLENDG